MKRVVIDNRPREYWEHLIEQWVFDEQARWLLRRHLLDGATYEHLAEELDISRSTVYNKITRYSEQLFKHSK